MSPIAEIAVNLKYSSFNRICSFLGDELESFDSDGDPTYIYSLKFCPKQASHNILAIASEEGIISIIDTSSSSSVINEFNAHKNAIFDVAWMPETDDKVRFNLAGEPI